MVGLDDLSGRSNLDDSMNSATLLKLTPRQTMQRPSSEPESTASSSSSWAFCSVFCYIPLYLLLIKSIASSWQLNHRMRIVILIFFSP